MEKFTESFTFDDILIEPHAHSLVTSRSSVDTSVNLGGVILDMPVISASMSLFDTHSPFETSEAPYIQFAVAIAEAGGMHIISRSTPFWPRTVGANVVASQGLNVGVAVSLTEFFENKKYLEKQNYVVSIDIANGAIIGDINWEGEKPLIIGNFGNPAIGMAPRFTGNIILKLGIGSGNACSTRLVTGVGAPQAGLVYSTALNSNFPLISDGGVNKIADFVKAIALGADAVMTGRMFGATIETPWSVKEVNGISMKPYRGMASKEEKRSKKFIEGASGFIPYEGKRVQEVMYDLKDGLTSAMSYCNSFGIKDFKRNATFIKASHSHESSVRLVT